MTAAMPRDPLARFLAVTRELAGHKHWFEQVTLVRYAALPLLVAQGEPAPLAARVAADGEAIRREQSWFSDLRGSMRFVVAAWLAAWEREPQTFAAACERIRGLFRTVGVRRGGAYEIVAATMLHVAGAGDEATVQRLQRIYATMREQHWWLTGPDDLPACALLAVRGGDLAAMASRIELFYRRLREHGLRAGPGLQMASHILCLAAGSEVEVVARFLALHDEFLAAGIDMWDTDRDEIALLCALPQDPAVTVRNVVAHRAEIRGGLRFLGPTVSFSLACGTAFFSAYAGQTLSGQTVRDVELATLAMAANAAHVHETTKRAAHG
jgi:hypothetical protein